MQVALPHDVQALDAADDMPAPVTWRSLAPTFALSALATFAVVVFAAGWRS